MDINEEKIKEEVSSFVSNLQRLLPKKKEIIVIEPVKAKLTRLSGIHAEAKNAFPKCFIGAKLNIARQIMDSVKLVQQYNYGKTKETYKCFTEMLHKEMKPKRSDDTLVVDSCGSATATYKEVIDDDHEIRLTSRIKDLVSSETDIVFERDNGKSVNSICCSLIDVDPNTLSLVTQWMYKVHPNFYFGTEVGIKPLSYPLSPDYSISGRYERSAFTLSSTINRFGYQICLFKQFAKDLRAATIINESIQTGSPTVGLALHKNYENGSELKIFVDSQRCGGFTFQKDVFFYEPHNEVRVLRLIGSTLIDKQRRVRFGIGLHLDF